MKTLIIMRHGKSELHKSGLDDFDRSLMPRGVNNAGDMGKYIAEKWGTPDIILSSAAARAHQTAILAAKNMNYPQENIMTDEKLYLLSGYSILRALSKLSDNYQSCLLVGHNPGLTDLVNLLGVKLDNLTTVSAVCFSFEISSWKEISGDYRINFSGMKLAREL